MNLAPKLLSVAVALTLSSTAAQALTISRLTPPSNPIVATATTLARFLPGQRFDLQTTVQPDAATTVSSVEFKVDGGSVAILANDGTAVSQFSGNTSLVKSGLVSGLAANTVVASIRAYSNLTPGMHTLTATATQSDGTTTTATGNFEVVGYTAAGRLAKNVIILLGDGMGAAHRTAARIMGKGYLQGKAQDRLAMDTFPYTGMVMTASLNSIVTDSAPGMANYVNGNKAQNNQEGVWPDDTADAFDNPRVEYLSEYLHRVKGTSLGLVTTADVFDATPAANAVHTSQRGYGAGIADQYLDDAGLTGLTVLMGGGRKWFLPNATGATCTAASCLNGSQRRGSYDYVLPADVVAGWSAAPGAIDPARDLIADFTTAGWTYTPTNTSLQTALAGGSLPAKLLGLYSFSNMNVAYDKINGRRCSTLSPAPATLPNGTSVCSVGIGSGPGGDGSQTTRGVIGTAVDDYGFPDQPMLDEMADAALKVLAQNPRGFVLMIEGASIDKQAHLMDSDRWLLETLEFDRAVQKAKDFATANPDTLVIVTADHECSGAAIIGASTATAATLYANSIATPTGTGTKVSLMRDGSPSAAIAPGAAPAAPVVGTYDAAKFPHYTIAADGYPTTTDPDYKMLIGYGANADRYETWLTSALPTQDSQQSFYTVAPLNSYPANPNVRNATTGFFVTGQAPADQAVHTATDIPLSAFGRGSSLFTGVMDNTDVFFKIGQAALGGGK